MRKLSLLCFILLSSLVSTAFSARITQMLTLNDRYSDLNKGAVKNILAQMTRATPEEIQAWLAAETKGSRNERLSNGELLNMFRGTGLWQTLVGAIESGLERLSGLSDVLRREGQRRRPQGESEELEAVSAPDVDPSLDVSGRQLSGFRPPVSSEVEALQREIAGLRDDNEQLRTRLSDLGRIAEEFRSKFEAEAQAKRSLEELSGADTRELTKKLGEKEAEIGKNVEIARRWQARAEEQELLVGQLRESLSKASSGREGEEGLRSKISELTARLDEETKRFASQKTDLERQLQEVVESRASLGERDRQLIARLEEQLEAARALAMPRVATTIQRVFRGRLARKEAARLRLAKEEASRARAVAPIEVASFDVAAETLDRMAPYWSEEAGWRDKTAEGNFAKALNFIRTNIKTLSVEQLESVKRWSSIEKDITAELQRRDAEARLQKEREDAEARQRLADEQRRLEEQRPVPPAAEETFDTLFRRLSGWNGKNAGLAGAVSKVETDRMLRAQIVAFDSHLRILVGEDRISGPGPKAALAKLKELK